MPLQSTLTQLENVQTAIDNVLAGQSVSFEGVSVTLANLSVLEARETRLMKQYRREQGTRPTFKRGKFAGGYD